MVRFAALRRQLARGAPDQNRLAAVGSNYGETRRASYSSVRENQ